MLRCAVLDEFSCEAAAFTALRTLEARRSELVEKPAMVTAAVETALEPLRESYRTSELPPGYFDAVENEVKSHLPALWQEIAKPFSAREREDFGIWRRGDVVARLAYVFGGLTLGSLIVWAPFIPIWEKWFPFALAIGAWWLPSAQRFWHRRRYARELGVMAQGFAVAQPRLDGLLTADEHLLSPSTTHETQPGKK